MEILDERKLLDENNVCRLCGEDLKTSVVWGGKDRAEKQHKEAHQQNLSRALIVAAKAVKMAVERRGQIEVGSPVFGSFSSAMTKMESWEEEYA